MSNTRKKRVQKTKMVQIHGKNESDINKDIRTMTSLDEILGENLSIYTAKSSDEYRSQLSEMNLSDLQSHAYKIGLIPTEDRRLLTERLVGEFMKFNSKYGSNFIEGQVRSVEDLDAQAKKILREGA
jgi:hypothetical protein